MNFGIHNPSWLYGPDPYEIMEHVGHKAQWAEQHGFTWFSVMDHLIQIPGVGAPEEPFMEGWTVLTALAAVTQKIRLGTLVTSVAYRSPALLAKMAATVDLISHGRLTFGIGAGWHVTEYQRHSAVRKSSTVQNWPFGAWACAPKICRGVNCWRRASTSCR